MGCEDKPATPPTPAAVPASKAGPASAPSSQPALTRAGQAEARLAAQGEAGHIVAQAIAAHGGLAAWYALGAIRFGYDYRPVDATKPPRTSVQTIELATARAVHDLTAPAQGRFAWDGQKAWMKLDTDKFAARFWALTPYYFVAMPFVLADEGVKLSLLDDDPAAAGFGDVSVVGVTFAQGTGDAPDDTYAAYVDKQTHRLVGLRYTVSYAPFFKGKDTTRSPEKLIVYEDAVTQKGFTLYKTQRFFVFGEGKKGAPVTVSTVSELALGVPFDELSLRMPEGAVLDTSMDGT